MECKSSGDSSPIRSASLSQQILSVGFILTIWLLCRWAFGTSLSGSDDSFYVRYARLMHRVPINHWEARLAYVWSLRLCFLAFGYSEYVCWVPGLFSSFLALVSVGWLAGWPRYPTWQGWSTMLLAATLPVDVIFSNYPVATSMAAGFLTLGTAALLQDGVRWRIVGSTVLSLSFVFHEYCVYLIAITCIVAIIFDFRGYLGPVAVCVALSFAFIAAESSYYYFHFGQLTYRFRLSATGMGDDRIIIEAGGSAVRYFVMPLQQLLFNRSLGFDLIVLFSAGLFALSSFTRRQQLLFVVAACFWLWAGYGPMTPWEYKPPSREIRLLFPYILPISYLLPSACSAIFSRRLAPLAIGLLVAAHLVCLASGGRWGQSSRNSRELLDYATAHPQIRFVTDVKTLNDMYIFNECKLPRNVVCVPGARSDEILLVNREPKPLPIRPDTSRVAAFLHNREANGQDQEPELQAFVSSGAGRATAQRPRVLKPFFRPFSRWLPDNNFFVLNEGWEVVEFDSNSKPSPL